ncbi:hypothetical protein [Rhizobium sp. TRM95796]|nr:hypothetical protein [Rhizobium sp. TRM95796]MCV3764764.1 hypothetical protein [Rhizobium sp. TRM95796]
MKAAVTGISKPQEGWREMVEKEHDGDSSAWNVVDCLGTKEATERFLKPL